MKLILFFAVFIFFIASGANGGDQSAKINISSSKHSVSVGEGFKVTVQIANIHTTDIILGDSQNCDFTSQWIIDNPSVQFLGGLCANANIHLEHTLKAGQEHSDQIDVLIPQKEDLPVVFKIGFKETVDSIPIWSNPISIEVKDQELSQQIKPNLPVQWRACKEDGDCCLGSLNCQLVPINKNYLKDPVKTIPAMYASCSDISREQVGVKCVQDECQLTDLTKDVSFQELKKKGYFNANPPKDVLGVTGK